MGICPQEAMIDLSNSEYKKLNRNNRCQKAQIEHIAFDLNTDKEWEVSANSNQ